MPLIETFFILLLAAVIWYWLDTLKAREIGVQAARNACREEGVQFLDETVVGRFAGLARDDAGQLRIRRQYSFEFSDTGDNRRPGKVALLGQAIEWLQLRPQLYVVPVSAVSHAVPEPKSEPESES